MKLYFHVAVDYASLCISHCTVQSGQESFLCSSEVWDAHGTQTIWNLWVKRLLAWNGWRGMTALIIHSCYLSNVVKLLLSLSV